MFQITKKNDSQYLENLLFKLKNFYRLNVDFQIIDLIAAPKIRIR